MKVEVLFRMSNVNSFVMKKCPFQEDEPGTNPLIKVWNLDKVH